jgi:hypothetical protein
MFDHAQFQETDLRNLHLASRSKFNHVNMTGIEFGEKPFLVLKAVHDGISSK